MLVANDVDRVLARAVEAGEVPGVVAVAADHQGVVYAGAFGKRAIDGDADMTLDTIFGIASMTKAVTSVAVMQLVEQGQLALDAPLIDYLPELKDIQVLDGFDDSGAPRLRPPRRAITLRHLLTHTAGFGYSTWNAELARYQAYIAPPGVGGAQAPASGADRKMAMLMMPLVFDPGERWEYGINTDWAGHALERASGQRIDRYFKEHIFEPLGMHDTSYITSPAQRERLAKTHQRHPRGSLEASASGSTREPDVFLGGGGLYSTGHDYLRFLRMLLGDGQLDGVRVLEARTVAEMNRNQIGDLHVRPLETSNPAVSNPVEFFPGIVKKWGLAYMINAQDTPAGRSAGGLAWGGLSNTYYWIEPARRMAGVILTQILPFGDVAVLNLLDQFERALYATRA